MSSSCYIDLLLRKRFGFTKIRYCVLIAHYDPTFVIEQGDSYRHLNSGTAFPILKILSRLKRYNTLD